jgi:trehalose 6-phosphate synthase
MSTRAAVSDLRLAEPSPAGRRPWGRFVVVSDQQPVIPAGGCPLQPVMLGAQDKRQCYGGFSGEVLWPLFHDLPQECSFRPGYWQAWLKVNRKLARAVSRALTCGGDGDDFVWVQDPLLMNVAVELRHLRAACRTAFFLHLPFPAPDLFLKLPWREPLLAGLLAYGQVGFQTERDLDNFRGCVRTLAAEVREERLGPGLWRLCGLAEGRPFSLRAGAFPMGIDCRQLEARAASPEVASRAAALRDSLRGRKLVIGVDRIDRAKGIPEKLRAFAEALTRYPELQDRVSLLQVAVPTRESLPRHAALRAEIERLVGEVNGSFGRPGWVPVHYQHRTLEPDELLAHYQAADVALVTPLKAGMHLGAKEYCAARIDGGGTLVLSEFAGAASQLASGALLVNPFDTQAMARALCRALHMPEPEAAARMGRLREEVRAHDVLWWADAFLAAALAEGAVLDARSAF